MLPRITKKLAAEVRNELLTNGFARIDTSKFFIGKRWFYHNPAKDYIEWPKWAIAYNNWLKKLLKAAIPEEDILTSYITWRDEKKDHVNNPRIQRFHLDHVYMRCLCTFQGEGTIFKHKGKEFQAAKGESIFITGKHRTAKLKIKSTPHRRPTTKKRRKLMVTEILCTTKIN